MEDNSYSNKKVNENKKNFKNPVNSINNIKIVHWNSNSLNNKKKEFDQLIIKDQKPDIISLN